MNNGDFSGQLLLIGGLIDMMQIENVVVAEVDGVDRWSSPGAYLDE